MSIITVNGEIDKNSLGSTYIHEHLSVDLSAHKKDPDTNFDDVESLIDEIKNIKSKGIDSIVEVTNRGMGRNIEVMKRVADETGINVIASTGFYKEPFLPSYVYEMEEKELSKLLIKDLTEGIDNTDIKAHVIGEIGTSKDTMTDMEHKIFRVAARAHLETGRVFSTHTTLGTYAIKQIEFMKKHNIDLSKVVIGHLDLNCDSDYHLRIADNGCYLAFDTIGKNNYEKDEVRVKYIKNLIDRGHLNQIVLSQDITRKSHLKINGGIGYDHLIDNFIPKLLEAGITQSQIDKMLKENPRELLDI